MKLKMFVVLSVALVAVIVAVTACKNNSANTNPSTNNVPASGTNAAAKPYPLDTCIVDDMKLGSMGTPYVFVYQGQEIKFCCADCKPEFLQDPDKYLKKIQNASPK